ncbi:MAG: hypothetical protein GY779_15275, partial [Gammaproteobacteria bacterium]|nr:hypothetical protein [Gammaproteobacteria bacterium]
SLHRKIEFGNEQYKLGLGGLHSVDKPGSFYSDDDTVLFDIDVASYYPRIILNAGYYPAHIGPVFLDIYRNIVETRLAAKKSGDKVTNAALKIVINGTFGKFGSKYSKLYSPDLMFHTTVTGQLCLLMLIEKLCGLVISANTDGITVAVPHHQLEKVQAIVQGWEDYTGFDMEWTKYRSLHRRDVNNYFAITAEGKIKTKGVFAEPGLSKNPANRVIYEAVIDHYKNGTPVESFIHGCDDVRKFLSLRTVNGGAKWGDELLGKSVRWYHSAISDKCVEYQTNGNKVPLTDNSVVLQDLPDYVPWDVDRSWYIDEAKKLIEVMG